MADITNTEISPSIVDKKQSFVDIAIKKTLEKTLTPERTTEFLASGVMIALENMHDMNLVPERYSNLGVTRDNVGPVFVPDNPAAAWALNHIGDIWEISVGFTVMRLGFVAVNETLKKIPAAKGYQIPDEACFWASLTSSLVVTATHSLGLYAGPYNSHVGNPVPEMLFGQGVAAIVLATSHYAAKYREPLKNLVIKAGKKTLEGMKVGLQKINEFRDKVNKWGTADVEENKKEVLNNG